METIYCERCGEVLRPDTGRVVGARPTHKHLYCGRSTAHGTLRANFHSERLALKLLLGIRRAPRRGREITLPVTTAGGLRVALLFLGVILDMSINHRKGVHGTKSHSQRRPTNHLKHALSERAQAARVDIEGSGGTPKHVISQRAALDTRADSDPALGVGESTEHRQARQTTAEGRTWRILRIIPCGRSGHDQH